MTFLEQLYAIVTGANLSSHLNFPLSAIFIGANLGLTSINFLKEPLRWLRSYLLTACMISLIVSALLSIISSEIVFPNRQIAAISVMLLILTYLYIICLCILSLRKRSSDAAKSDLVIGVKQETDRLTQGHQPQADN